MARACILSVVGFLSVAGAAAGNCYGNDQVWCQAWNRCITQGQYTCPGSQTGCNYEYRSNSFSNDKYLADLNGQSLFACKDICTNWQQRCPNYAGNSGNYAVWNPCSQECGGFSMHQGGSHCTLFPPGSNRIQSGTSKYYQKDCNGGGGANGGSQCKTVRVGSSPYSGTKTVNNLNLYGYDCPNNVNRNNWMGGGQYGDQFSVSQTSNSVTVRRTDGTHWGMNLMFQCCRGNQPPGNACRKFAGRWGNAQNAYSGGYYTISVNSNCRATFTNPHASWSPATGDANSQNIRVSFGGIPLNGRLSRDERYINWDNGKTWTRQNSNLRLFEAAPFPILTLHSAAFPLLGIAALLAAMVGFLVIRRRRRRASTPVDSLEGEDVELKMPAAFLE